MEDDPPELVAAEQNLAQIQVSKGEENDEPAQEGKFSRELAIFGNLKEAMYSLSIPLTHEDLYQHR